MKNKENETYENMAMENDGLKWAVVGNNRNNFSEEFISTHPIDFIEEMLGDLRACLNEALGIVQNLSEDGVEIERLSELYDKVEEAFDLSTEVLDNYPDGEE